jgi:hypothetical protein
MWFWPVSDIDKQRARIQNYILKDKTALEAWKRIAGAIKQPFFTPYGSDYYTALASACGELTLLLHAVVLGAGPNRKTYVEAFTEETGKTWKQIAGLPERIENMAREIREVNAGPFFFPVHRAFQDLPIHLHLYATALKRRTTLDYTEPKQYLMETVKNWTGSYHDTEVATLLQAAADALGIRSQCDAQALRQSRYRHHKNPRRNKKSE